MRDIDELYSVVKIQLGGSQQRYQPEFLSRHAARALRRGRRVRERAKRALPADVEHAALALPVRALNVGIDRLEVERREALRGRARGELDVAVRAAGERVLVLFLGELERRAVLDVRECAEGEREVRYC